MNIVGLQWNPVWQDTQANLQALQQALTELFAKQSGKIDVVVLPEVFLSGFSMQPSKFAEPLHGESIQQLQKLAQQFDCYLIGGVATVAENSEQVFNSALVINPAGEIIANYQKQKLFAYADEHKSYQAGSHPKLFQVVDSNAVADCALFVCYDLRFPELFREVAQQVDMIFIIASWPESRQLHWESLLKARAIENQCFVIGVNRIGVDGNQWHYAGGSMVVSPLGEVMAYGGKEDALIQAEIDSQQSSKVREQFPFLADM